MRITKANRFLIIMLFLGIAVLAYCTLKVSQHVDKLEQKIDARTCPLPEKFSFDELSLIPKEITRAIIMVESKGKARAYNKYTGAVGLMQLTPIVYDKVCGLSKQEAFIPEANIACGSLFMKSLLKRYNDNLEKALHFYNNGYKGNNNKYVGKVKKYLTKDDYSRYNKSIGRKK